MLNRPEFQLLLAQEQRARQAREAADERLLGRPGSRRLRRALGLSFVRVGRWLSAEPSLSPARPR